MGKASKRCLDAAQYDRRVLVCAPDEVAIDHVGMVWALAHDSTRSVEVFGPVVLGDSVVQDHRVHVAAADEKAELRLAEDCDRGGVVPVGLGDDADTVAMLLEHAGDDGRGKGRVVHIGIADHEDEVALVPATSFHVLLRDRKELAAGGTRRHGWHRASVMMRFRRGFLRLAGACLALPCALRMFRLPPLM